MEDKGFVPNFSNPIVCSFTKCIPELNKLPYEMRLKHLNLTTLGTRRIRGDLIEMYRIMNGIEAIDWKLLFSKAPYDGTRGHTMKLEKKVIHLDIYKYFSSQRVIDYWNALPQPAIDAKSINQFKSLLINCSDILAIAFKLMFSQALTQGFFPSALKRTAIVPIFKSADKSILGNYRPISLTSCISKVFERIIRKQVLAFLERKGLLNSTQHGFKRGWSCLSTLLNVFDNMMDMIDSSTTVDMI